MSAVFRLCLNSGKDFRKLVLEFWVFVKARCLGITAEVTIASSMYHSKNMFLVFTLSLNSRKDFRKCQLEF
jgi:hypothetical protein